MAGGRAGATAAGSGSEKAGAGAMAGGNGGRASTGLFGAAGMAIPGTAGQVAALPTFKPEEALMRKKSLITAETFRPVNA